MTEHLLGKCGFYCGSCPSYTKKTCSGCIDEHKKGDCYTRDCVIKNNLPFCGKCTNFPCDAILSQPRTTVLDKDWLRWKLSEKK